MTERGVYFQSYPFFAASLFTLYDIRDEVTSTRAYLVQGLERPLFDALREGKSVRLDQNDPAVAHLLERDYTIEAIAFVLKEMEAAGIALQTENGYEWAFFTNERFIK